MGIYTKKGDQGETSLYGGTRLPKDALRVWCYGTVDEANSVLGVIYAGLRFDSLKQTVRGMQQNLFVLGAMLASDEKGAQKLSVRLTAADVHELESVIDRLTAELGAVSGFVIPGDTVGSSLFHVARTIVRRAERHVVSLAAAEPVDPVAVEYLNRLSDALFTMARAEAFYDFVGRVAEKVTERLGTEEPGMDQSAWNADPFTSGEENMKKLYPIYEKMAEAVRAEAEKIGVPMSFAVTDEYGSLQYVKRMPGTLPVSTAIAINKAYTAASLRMSTAAFASQALPSGSLYGINMTDPRLVTFGGGQLLMRYGTVAGAVGVSGGSVEQDDRCGSKAVEVFLRLV